MGNTCSATLRVVNGKAAEVAFDLRQERVVISYELAEDKGRFEIPLNLGEKVVALPDVAALARSGALEAVTYPIDLEDRERLSSSKGIAAIEGSASLVKGAPLTQREVVQEGEWLEVGRLDTDLGSVAVLARVSRDIRTWVQVDLDRKNWIGRKRSWAIGRAQGMLQVAVKARFESQGDRSFVGKLLRRAASSVRSIMQLFSGKFKPVGPWRNLPSNGAGAVAGAAVPSGKPAGSDKVQPWGSPQQLQSSAAPTKQADTAKVQGGRKAGQKEGGPCKTM